MNITDIIEEKLVGRTYTVFYFEYYSYKRGRKWENLRKTSSIQYRRC